MRLITKLGSACLSIAVVLGAATKPAEGLAACRAVASCWWASMSQPCSCPGAGSCIADGSICYAYCEGGAYRCSCWGCQWIN